ncbi:hypothetical protein TUBRATIS_007580 [Tubulinosema ratisbonensis]|uniref:Uncharacterized protein n=1 Tax=Tubulinosema ratisbonensis TaxID=291195 RepID=A0A437ANP1_9MICR|nr:hypothetical protein TUBRATIS_007580 [Tubulinosema ratisbonensis]
MQEENFDNLETDLQMAKQKFNEAKYVILETGSFNVFLERFSKEQFKDPKITHFKKEVKERLEVIRKDTGDLESEIKRLSEDIHLEKEEIVSLEKKEKELERKIEEFEIKNEEFEKEKNEILQFNALKEELQQSEKEREILIVKKVEKEKEVERFNLANLQEKVKSLTIKKEDLLDQEKSIQKDKSDLEDLYLWYKNGFELTEKLFGYKYEGFSTEDSVTTVNLSVNGKTVKIILEDNNLKDILAEEYDWVNELKEVSVRMNDPRIFLLEYKKNMK